MTLIPEEVESRRETDTEREKVQNEAKQRGQEVTAFVQKELTAIDQCRWKLIASQTMSLLSLTSYI